MECPSPPSTRPNPSLWSLQISHNPMLGHPVSSLYLTDTPTILTFQLAVMAYNVAGIGTQSAYHQQDDPPIYSASASAPTERSDNGEGASDRYTDAEEAPRSSKTSYALTLQKACDKAIRAVKGNHIVANSNWAAPLSTAPSAIATMAILFKVADQECAAGLEVDSLEIMDLDHITLRGKLP